MTTQQAQHTPGPWYLEGSPYKVRASIGVGKWRTTVADCDVDTTLIPEQKANAEFITRACNSHADLLAALLLAENALAFAESYANRDQPRIIKAHESVRAAIAKATGGQP